HDPDGLFDLVLSAADPPRPPGGLRRPRRAGQGPARGRGSGHDRAVPHAPDHLGLHRFARRARPSRELPLLHRRRRGFHLFERRDGSVTAGRPAAPRSRFLALALLEIMLLGSSACCTAAQDSTTTAPRVTSTFGRTGEEQDRFELGIGAVQGFFDVTGSFAYRRFLNERGPFERSVMGELTGTAKSQLTEGAVSIYVLLRPTGSYRQGWRIRPLFEF